MFKSPGQIRDYLTKKREYKVIGSGLHSMALHKPPHKKIIKLSRDMDMWPDYILWAKEHNYLGNKAPLVYSLRIEKEHHEHQVKNLYYVASVELLTDANDSPEQTDLIKKIECYVRIHNCGSHDQIDLPDDWKEFLENYKMEFKMYPSDLGGRNWLSRQGELVLNDPSGSDSRYKQVQKLKIK
jgi:hypothetical protein